MRFDGLEIRGREAPGQLREVVGLHFVCCVSNRCLEEGHEIYGGGSGLERTGDFGLVLIETSIFCLAISMP